MILYVPAGVSGDDTKLVPINVVAGSGASAGIVISIFATILPLGEMISNKYVRECESPCLSLFVLVLGIEN